MKCLKCGKELEANEYVCQGCGELVSNMYKKPEPEMPILSTPLYENKDNVIEPTTFSSETVNNNVELENIPTTNNELYEPGKEDLLNLNNSEEDKEIVEEPINTTVDTANIMPSIDTNIKNNDIINVNPEINEITVTNDIMNSNVQNDINEPFNPIEEIDSNSEIEISQPVINLNENENINQIVQPVMPIELNPEPINNDDVIFVDDPVAEVANVMKKKTKKEKTKKMSKKLFITLIVIAVAIVLLCIALVVNKLLGVKNVDKYKIDKDSIPSITAVLGGRKLDSTEETSDSSKKQMIYKYIEVEDPTKDLASYVAYLKQNYNFINSTAYDLTEIPGELILGVESKDSGYVFMLYIEYTGDSYRITVEKLAGSVVKY